MAAALGSPDSAARKLGVDLRGRLWDALLGITLDQMRREDQVYVERIILAFVALDPADLVQRVVDDPNQHDWVIQCVVRFAPWPVAAEHGLHQLIEHHERWRDFSGIENRRGVDTDKAARFLEVLKHPETYSEEQRQRAAVKLGAIRDRSAVPHLIDLFRNDSSYTVANQALTSLARIGGEQAANMLCDVLLGVADLSHLNDSATLRFTAAVNGLNVNAMGAITPGVRDRLLRVIATSPAESVEADLSLEALVGLPIREGAEVLAALLDSGNPLTRERVARLMTYTYSPEAREALFDQLTRETSSEVRGAILGALVELAPEDCPDKVRSWIRDPDTDPAIQRQSLQWLAASIRQSSTANSREEGQCLLTVLIDESLRNPSYSLADLVFEQTDVFSQAEAARLLRQLEDRIGDLRLSDGSGVITVARIVRALGQMRIDEAIEPMNLLLRSMLKIVPPTMSESSIKIAPEAMAGELLAEATAQALLDLDPTQLLAYPGDWPPVERTLKAWSIQTHHLIYDDHIMDANGHRLKSKLAACNEDGKLQQSTANTQPTYGISANEISLTCIVADQRATKLRQAIMDGDFDSAFEHKKEMVRVLTMLVPTHLEEEIALEWFFEGLFKPELGKKLFSKGGRQAVFGPRTNWRNQERRLQVYMKRLNRYTDSNNDLENALLNIGLIIYQWRPSSPSDGRFGSLEDLPDNDE